MRTQKKLIHIVLRGRSAPLFLLFPSWFLPPSLFFRSLENLFDISLSYIISAHTCVHVHKIRVIELVVTENKTCVKVTRNTAERNQTTEQFLR